MVVVALYTLRRPGKTSAITVYIVHISDIRIDAVYYCALLIFHVLLTITVNDMSEIVHDPLSVYDQL